MAEVASSPSPASSAPPDKNTVYIAVLGDSGVGKTSLVTAATTETFPEHPPPVLPPARLPADTTPEGVPVVITDTSSRPEDKAALEAAVRQASVIVLCFSMEKPQTLRRASSHWLPELRRLGAGVPVILVGCKSDARPADQSLHQAVLPIVKTFPQIETCMECSAKKLQFVGEVFYYALKSVIHPMAPLYEPEAQKLRPLCARALKRIFTLCDADRDGVLSDAELNAFQVECFNAPLQPEELVGVKQVVSEKCPEGIARDGLTLKGFLFLHALFIERGRLETTWAVLRRYGYDNTLRLRDDVLARARALAAACGPDQVVEVTPAGRAFLRAVFAKFDADGDHALSAKERDDLFSTAPEDPWRGGPYEGVLVEASRRNGHVTEAGFLALWAYTAAADPAAALAGAIYLGFPADGPLEGLLCASKPRRGERGGRATLRCAAFAAKGVDVRPVLEGLITQARPAHAAAPGPVTVAVAAVPLPPAEADAAAPAEPADPAVSAASADDAADAAPEVTMILRGFSADAGAALMESSSRGEELQRYDAAVFVYDGAAPESFRAAVEAAVGVASASGDALPCLLLCVNEGASPPALAAEVGAACSALGLRPPLTFPHEAAVSPRAAAATLRGVFQALAAAALRPEGHIPLTPSLKAAQAYRRMLRRAAIAAAGGTAAGLAAYFAYRWSQQHRASKDTTSTSTH